MALTDETMVRESGSLNHERPEVPIVDRVISADQLRQSLKRQRAVSTMKLGTRLLELKLITEQQLDNALRVQNSDSRRHLGEILLDLGVVSRRQLDQVLCEKLGIPLIELAQFKIDKDILRSLPEDLVRQSSVIPLCRIDGKLVVAVSDPLDSEPLERVRFCVQTPVIPVMAPREDIEQAIESYYSRGDATGREASTNVRPLRLETRKPDLTLEAVPTDDAESSIGRLVTKMIADARAVGASDIHVDTSAGAQHVTVRFRGAGGLSEYLRLPANLRNAIAARIKAMAGIDISERRRAQEGRIDTIEGGPADLQLRVVTVPTRDGNEDIAIRIVPNRELIPLQKLGMSAAVLESVQKLAALPRGLLVVSGPAGSGTTTTAYGIVGLREAAAAKIWTIESPVEATRSAWSQVEVNARVGWDYPAIMHTVARADPDVVLLGDMRSRETTALAVEAALERSLVVAAMRAHSAVETVARLLEMGVDTFGLSDALVGVLAQRLARRVCPSCRVSRTLTPSELDGLIQEYCDGTQVKASQVRSEWTQRYGSTIAIYGGQGCELCAGTGYSGHIGFYELMSVGPAVRTLMLQKRGAAELAAAAMQSGMRTLKQDGIEKALAGYCDMREVRASTI
jgi:type II secretory ATPase GspE/PulE/Tfp pilus assembly ATPase PilB-like protein